MAGLNTSRNTPEWNGANRFHWGLVPVEAATSIYVGSMVAINNNSRAVPAQARGVFPLDQLQVIGVCEYVYAGGILPPGINALNQTGQIYPGAVGTVGAAGAISVGVVCGVFGMDIDGSVTGFLPTQVLYAVDDHTVGQGTLTANTTSIVMPAAAPLVVALKPDIAPGTLDAYSATGGGGTHYREGVDYSVAYQSGTFTALTGGAIAAGATVFVTYRSAATLVAAGRMVALDAGLAFVDFNGQGV